MAFFKTTAQIWAGVKPGNPGSRNPSSNLPVNQLMLGAQAERRRANSSLAICTHNAAGNGLGVVDFNRIVGPIVSGHFSVNCTNPEGTQIPVSFASEFTPLGFLLSRDTSYTCVTSGSHGQFSVLYNDSSLVFVSPFFKKTEEIRPDVRVLDAPILDNHVFPCTVPGTIVKVTAKTVKIDGKKGKPNEFQTYAAVSFLANNTVETQHYLFCGEYDDFSGFNFVISCSRPVCLSSSVQRSWIAQAFDTSLTKGSAKPSDHMLLKTHSVRFGSKNRVTISNYQDALTSGSATKFFEIEVKNGRNTKESVMAVTATKGVEIGQHRILDITGKSTVIGLIPKDSDDMHIYRVPNEGNPGIKKVTVDGKVQYVETNPKTRDLIPKVEYVGVVTKSVVFVNERTTEWMFGFDPVKSEWVLVYTGKVRGTKSTKTPTKEAKRSSTEAHPEEAETTEATSMDATSDDQPDLLVPGQVFRFPVSKLLGENWMPIAGRRFGNKENCTKFLVETKNNTYCIDLCRPKGTETFSVTCLNDVRSLIAGFQPRYIVSNDAKLGLLRRIYEESGAKETGAFPEDDVSNGNRLVFDPTEITSVAMPMQETQSPFTVRHFHPTKSDIVVPWLLKLNGEIEESDEDKAKKAAEKAAKKVKTPKKAAKAKTPTEEAEELIRDAMSGKIDGNVALYMQRCRVRDKENAEAKAKAEASGDKFTPKRNPPEPKVALSTVAHAIQHLMGCFDRVLDGHATREGFFARFTPPQGPAVDPEARQFSSDDDDDSDEEEQVVRRPPTPAAKPAAKRPKKSTHVVDPSGQVFSADDYSSDDEEEEAETQAPSMDQDVDEEQQVETQAPPMDQDVDDKHAGSNADAEVFTAETPYTFTAETQ